MPVENELPKEQIKQKRKPRITPPPGEAIITKIKPYPQYLGEDSDSYFARQHEEEDVKESWLDPDMLFMIKIFSFVVVSAGLIIFHIYMNDNSYKNGMATGYQQGIDYQKGLNKEDTWH